MDRRLFVITSYSIHYTKLYDAVPRALVDQDALPERIEVHPQDFRDERSLGHAGRAGARLPQPAVLLLECVEAQQAQPELAVGP